MEHKGIRPLFPEQVRQRDFVTIMSGIGRFIAREGYWPTSTELASFLKADKGATVYCLITLAKQQLVQRGSKKGGCPSYSLTARGWQFIGFTPIEPWGMRPSKALYRRAIREAAAKVLRDEAALQENPSG
jgi:hypothetical protein